MTGNEKTRGLLGDHPLVESIGRAAALNDFFAFPVRYPDPGRWIQAESLFQQRVLLAQRDVPELVVVDSLDHGAIGRIHLFQHSTATGSEIDHRNHAYFPILLRGISTMCLLTLPRTSRRPYGRRGILGLILRLRFTDLLGLLPVRRWFFRD